MRHYRTLADSCPIWLIGHSFDTLTRHLVDCEAERFEKGA